MKMTLDSMIEYQSADVLEQEIQIMYMGSRADWLFVGFYFLGQLYHNWQ